MSKDETLPTIDLAYAGRRLTAKDTIGYEYLPVDADGKATGEDAHFYKKNVVPYAAIGTIWRFKVPEPGKVRISDVERVGKIEDTTTLLQMEAMDRDQAGRHEELVFFKREKEQSLIREAMLPIRIAMHKSRSVSDSTFVAACQRELWRPLTMKEASDAGLA